jgi:predicted ABC-type transport system involved in lysophospholipase L1 biosynthesis ATPase subunit
MVVLGKGTLTGGDVATNLTLAGVDLGPDAGDRSATVGTGGSGRSVLR